MQDVIAAAGPEFATRHHLPWRVREVLRHMTQCGTGERGFNLLACDECGGLDWVPRGCGDRHCPSCHKRGVEEWVQRRERELFPVPYFHLVFTLPPQLRGLCLENRRSLLDLLMRTVRETLQTFAEDPRHLGAVPSLLLVLHTWNQRLDFHPHVHVVISAGGFRATDDTWVPARHDGYLFPVRALSKVFRGKLLDGLKSLRHADSLCFDAPQNQSLGTRYTWRKLLDTLYASPFVVYAKRPFGGPRQVLRYLARYTHRTAISNGRLLTVDDQRVTFRYNDRRAMRQRTRTLDVDAFLRLFCTHILPKRFHRIRFAGLLAPNRRVVLARARRAAAQHCQVDLPEPTLAVERPTSSVCPHCGHPERRVLLTLLQPEPYADQQRILATLGARPPPSPTLVPQRRRAA